MSTTNGATAGNSGTADGGTGTTSATTGGATSGATTTTGAPTTGTGVSTTGTGPSTNTTGSTTTTGTTGAATTTTGEGTTTSGAGTTTTGADGGVSSGGADAGMTTGGPASKGGCAAMPTGEFETVWEDGTGPDGGYTVVRPATLGEGGVLHPIVAWGNGVVTTADVYMELLQRLAANGFVVISEPGVTVTPAAVRAGLEWMIEQNGSGEYAGKLAVDCTATIGYSMGGGAAVGAGSHPAVKAVVHIHGLQDAAENVSGPLLITTSDDDSFVTASGYSQPTYDRSSTQPTVMATHITGNTPSFDGHLEPLGNGGEDSGPAVAWLRYWLYGDQSQRDWFFGSDCGVCTSPWADVQRKNHDWD